MKSFFDFDVIILRSFKIILDEIVGIILLAQTLLNSKLQL